MLLKKYASLFRHRSLLTMVTFGTFICVNPFREGKLPLCTHALSYMNLSFQLEIRRLSGAEIGHMCQI